MILHETGEGELKFSTLRSNASSHESCYTAVTVSVIKRVHMLHSVVHNNINNISSAFGDVINVND